MITQSEAAERLKSDTQAHAEAVLPVMRESLSRQMTFVDLPTSFYLGDLSELSAPSLTEPEEALLLYLNRLRALRAGTARAKLAGERLAAAKLVEELRANGWPRAGLEERYNLGGYPYPYLNLDTGKTASPLRNTWAVPLLAVAALGALLWRALS